MSSPSSGDTTAMRIRWFRSVLLLWPALGCGKVPAPAEGPLTVFNAGSLARPIRVALDSFALQEGVEVAQESAGSLETARKLTELGQVPDLVALADVEVFPRYLMPSLVSGYVEFATNRMVIAFTDRSRFASEMTPERWSEVLQRPGVETGRSDPQLDPNGYRTLMVFQLAELHQQRPGLAARLLAAHPPRNVRPKEADLVGLLQAGELDYIWSYESMARTTGLRYLRLDPRIDLSDTAHAAFYQSASVRVRGRTPEDSVTFRGEPIRYGFAIPVDAPHRAIAEHFGRFLLSEVGRRILRAQGLEVFDDPARVGEPGAWTMTRGRP